MRNVDPRESVFSKLNPKVMKAVEWFKDYKPEDEGLQYVYDSLFHPNKYLQSRYMLKGMIKFVLYLYKSKKTRSFKYKYNADRINRIVRFFKNNLILSEGTFKGKPFILHPSQVYQISRIFGFATKNEHGIKFLVNRHYNVAVRKQGKSELWAALVLFISLNPFQNDNLTECYASGPVKESSDIIYKKVQNFLSQNPDLSSYFVKNNTRSIATAGGGKVVKLAFEKKSLEGKNPSLCIATEYHLHPSDLMVDSVESAQNLSRPNSLMIFDTTKGNEINGVAYLREHDYKNDIDIQLENPDKLHGENISTFIGEIDTDDDYDEILNPIENNILRKSNSMLGIITSLESLQREWNTVRHAPTRRAEFIIKKIGKWAGLGTGILELDDLIATNKKHKYDIEELKGQPAMIALDLANTGDTNAVSLIFKDKKKDSEIFISYTMTFIPKNTLDERIFKERKPYLKWVESGWVRLSGERAVDYKDIADYIAELFEDYNIKNVYWDPYHHNTIKAYLLDIHRLPKNMFEDNSVAQSAKELSAPMENIINKIYSREFYSFDNPVTADQFLNVVPSYNSNGQMYFTKGKKQNSRIDHFASNCTGMARFSELKPIGTKQKVHKVLVW